MRQVNGSERNAGGGRLGSRRVNLIALALIAVLLGASCGGAAPAARTSRARALGEPVEFVFVDQSGARVSSESTRGRVTIAALVTTYDWGSQLVLRRVNQALGSHVPRINAFGVVLEAPSYGVLVSAYSNSLGLHFPLVMADQASLEGGGPLGPIDYVPTLVILDPQGRVVERLKGLVSPEQIHAALDRAGGSAPRREIPER